MRVGVARETAPGERRVALVPETVGKLAAAGFEVVVEPGAGEAASFPDDAYTEAGATLGSPWEADAVVKVRKPDEAEAARLRDGQLLIGYPRSARRPRGRRAARRARRGRVRDGVDPAHHARAVDGRAVVAGDGRRLQGRAARGRASPPLLPDADDRGGHGAAGEGARDRCRRRRAPGDRDRAPARRRRHRLRRPPRRARADREPRRELARPRRHRRGGRGRLRPRADARGDAGAAAGARGAHRRVRRRDHDRGGAGPRGARRSFPRPPCARCGPAR